MPDDGRPRPSGSVGEVLGKATERLQQAGVLNPKRESTALWAAVVGSTPGDVWVNREGIAAPEEADRFWKAVGRRAGGAPFPYAVGHAGFRNLDLLVDARALIPRPETEGLVGLVLEWAGNRRDGHGLAADVGTGSGCIALALAQEGEFAGVVATERSPQAAALARENVARVAPRVPVEVREGDLLGPLAGSRYRVIVSNPPYLTEEEYGALDPSVRAYEPREALVSGVDGLDATRVLLSGAAALLEPGGLLALEIDEGRGAEVSALAHEHGWRRIGIHDDLFGRPRFALAFPGEGM
ncbi:MAG TPA: peptide chain release factor N(5)-glutamine methyltransferase [Gemmatimonadales bacterium]|nr:peptide chain release factor N(5)-glutamine methyltransferase [Gemmatimonadales bacterium]